MVCEREPVFAERLINLFVFETSTKSNFKKSANKTQACFVSHS